MYKNDYRIQQPMAWMQGRPVHAVAFNGRKADMLATGDAGGIQIWRLPAWLSASRKGEENMIKKMAAADDVDEYLKQQRARG